MKRNILALLLCAVLLLTACTAAPTHTTPPTTTAAPTETTQPFDLAEYKATVQASADKIADGKAIMEYTAYVEAVYLDSLLSVSGTVSTDKLLKYASEKLTTEIGVTMEIMQNHFDSITSEYKTIILAPISGAEAEEIDRLYRELYLAYSDLYRLATDPPTDFDKLTETRQTACEAIDRCMQQLGIFLEQ